MAQWKTDNSEFLKLIKRPPENRRKLNYLIVMPRSVADNNQQYFFPIGIAYISAALKAAGRNVFTLNLNYKPEDNRTLIKNAIENNNIDVIMTGGITVQYSALKEIFDIAKKVSPRVITICGGGMITGDPEAGMAALETADYGVVGEGEITINDLAYALETNGGLSEVNGIIYPAAFNGGGGGVHPNQTAS